MSPAAVHRLLHAPTAVWSAHLAAHPEWSTNLAQCLRAQTVSPLAVTTNLRKLTDCMADAQVQPLLCAWLSQHFLPLSKTTNAAARTQESLSKCIRSLQMHAIASGQTVNILPRMAQLAALSQTPLAPEELCSSWLPKQHDLYTTPASPGEYFSNGKSLGRVDTVKSMLGVYKKLVVDALWSQPETATLTRKTLAKGNIAPQLSLDYPGVLNASMACALLWEPQRLATPMKQALACYWLHDQSPWSTRAQVIERDPVQAKQWEDWAQHACMYLELLGGIDVPAHLADIHMLNTIVEALAACPAPDKPMDPMVDIDHNVFSELQSMVE